MWFWKRINPPAIVGIEAGEYDDRIADSHAAFEIDGLTAAQANAVDHGLRENRLGHAEFVEGRIICSATRGWEDFAAAAAIHVLRRSNAPLDSVLQTRTGALKSVWRTEAAFVRGKRLRVRPKVGDVYSYRSQAQKWFARVVRDDVPSGVGRDALLVYFYRVAADIKAKVSPKLSRDELLIPPMKVDESAWGQGYLSFVGNESVKSEDVLPRHCFKHDLTGDCFDERDQPAQCSEPCGRFDVAVWMTVQAVLCVAHGIPLAGPALWGDEVPPKS